MNEIISDELRLQRQTLKLNLKSASLKTGVSVSTLCAYENNKRKKDVETIAKIVEGYGIELYIFFGNIVAKMQNKIE